MAHFCHQERSTTSSQLLIHVPLISSFISISVDARYRINVLRCWEAHTQCRILFPDTLWHLLLLNFKQIGGTCLPEQRTAFPDRDHVGGIGCQVRVAWGPSLAGWHLLRVHCFGD